MLLDANEINNLTQRIALLLDQQQHQRIAFISANSGEGVSTIARCFAENLAVENHYKCLLIDAGPLDKARLITAGINPVKIDPANGMVENVLAGDTPARVAQQIEENLFLARWCGLDTNRPKAGQLARDKNFWNDLSQQFDRIVIDAPALQTSSDGIALAVQADAVVMVVEAEKTRAAVAANLRDTLIAAGANLIGSILNKRRKYIPEKRYQRL